MPGMTKVSVIAIEIDEISLLLEFINGSVLPMLRNAPVKIRSLETLTTLTKHHEGIVNHHENPIGHARLLTKQGSWSAIQIAA